jgi:hypothetical protein
MNAFIIAALLGGQSFIGCPSSIIDTQNMKPVPGWEVRTRRGVRILSAPEVFIGRPEDLGMVEPEIDKNRVMKWSFGDHEVWVKCYYNNSAIELVRKLPKVSQCTFKPAAYEKKIPASFVCN